MKPGVYQLRSQRCFGVVKKAIGEGGERFGARITDYSVQGNHIHLIVEARERKALGRFMQGFCIRLAKRLNRVTKRKGPVFAERYHALVLRTPRQVRHALAYVLNNIRRHARQWSERYPASWIDPFSSALWFDGWRERSVPELDRETGPPPAAKSRTWLRTTGWRRWGLVRFDEVPG